jgi:hypothetical protein
VSIELLYVSVELLYVSVKLLYVSAELLYVSAELLYVTIDTVLATIDPAYALVDRAHVIGQRIEFLFDPFQPRISHASAPILLSRSSSESIRSSRSSDMRSLADDDSNIVGDIFDQQSKYQTISGAIPNLGVRTRLELQRITLTRFAEIEISAVSRAQSPKPGAWSPLRAERREALA